MAWRICDSSTPTPIAGDSDQFGALGVGDGDGFARFTRSGGIESRYDSCLGCVVEDLLAVHSEAQCSKLRADSLEGWPTYCSGMMLIFWGGTDCVGCGASEVSVGRGVGVADVEVGLALRLELVVVDSVGAGARREET